MGSEVARVQAVTTPEICLFYNGRYRPGASHFCLLPKHHDGNHSYRKKEPAMKYQRTVLIQKANEVKALHVQMNEAKFKREMEDYDRALKRYQEVHKPKNLELAKKMMDQVKKDIPVDTYQFRQDIVNPPKKPEPIHDTACIVAVRNLNMLLEVLDSTLDDEITATALARAGIKELTKVLAKPC